MRVRGLKLASDCTSFGHALSHPVRVRGLKQELVESMLERGWMSHPVRVRGLKLRPGAAGVWPWCVAPRAGAWVETGIGESFKGMKSVAPRAGAWVETEHGGATFEIREESHPVRVRGLKLRAREWRHSRPRSPPVRVRGLKP